METEPQVVYEHQHFLIINKPAGLLAHPDGHSNVPTLSDWLLTHFPDLVEVGEPGKLANGALVPRPGIVHRLDRGTSGVMVVAKDQPAYFWLKEAFRSRSITKAYRLLVHGHFKQSSGTIDMPISRSHQDPRRRVTNPRAVGHQRLAVTDYQVLQTFSRHTYLEAYPHTGRTHQLRVHFQSIQHPIVGDQLYAPNFPSPPTLERSALHAYYLGLPPWPTEIAMPRFSFIVGLPLDFFTTLVFLHQS